MLVLKVGGGERENQSQGYTQCSKTRKERQRRCRLEEYQTQRTTLRISDVQYVGRLPKRIFHGSGQYLLVRSASWSTPWVLDRPQRK